VSFFFLLSGIRQFFEESALMLIESLRPVQDFQDEDDTAV
jgi:hypothetical protein